LTDATAGVEFRLCETFIEDVGWILVLNGLFAVGVTAILAVFRGDDPTATWQAFLQIYAFAFGMVWAGFAILKWIGAWPSDVT